MRQVAFCMRHRTAQIERQVVALFFRCRVRTLARGCKKGQLKSGAIARAVIVVISHYKGGSR